MRVSLFMLMYTLTASAALAFLLRVVGGHPFGICILLAAFAWFVGLGTLLAIRLNPDPPTTRTMFYVQWLLMAAIVLLIAGNCLFPWW